ncbi:MAG: type IV pilus assembly protein PilM, nonfunctional [Microgenomates group bacterium GW2011_GWF2_45_18]|nr:MAG: type IV pilus assembly protein PilM, nonfunctional [Microgenomates group bacterium GW2011_GWF1_44_10]KKU01762.1 MAG: type IV pilus assembly protein PilM, nonfunctional [Microgenomates group bacterium GW2011_GWF2_45_18]
MGLHIGLDVGTYSIKTVALRQQKNAFIVERASMIANPLGLVIPSQQADRDRFVELLKHMIKDQTIPSGEVHVGLPEAFVSTKIVEMPHLSDQELSSAVGWQAEQYIPIPADDLQLEYQVLYRPPKNDPSQKMRVLMIGVSKTFVTSYVDLFYQAGLDVRSLGTQTMSIFRLANLDHTLPTTLIVNIGATTTDMVVVHNHELAFTYSYPNGGAVLSRAIERGLGLSASQAEEYKRTYGMDETQLEGKIKQAMMPIFQPFMNEMQKAMQYFSGSFKGATVQKILVAGGGSAMNSISAILAEQFQVEIAPFIPSQMVFAPTVKVLPADIPSYVVSFGYALEGVL